MKELIYLFPGQGSQYVGMGEGLWKQDSHVKMQFEEASHLLHINFEKLIFEDVRNELDQTDYLQPAMSLVNAAFLSVLTSLGAHPIATAGHSLGELSAYCAAGVYDFKTLMMLASTRGRAMHEASIVHPGAMSAIVGLTRAHIEALIAETSSSITIANMNTPQQIVVSGEVAGLAALEAHALSAGAKKVKRLKVSGAWHSPLMTSAQGVFEKTVLATNFADACMPLYCNSDAAPEYQAACLKQKLYSGLTSPVYWVDVIQGLRGSYPNALFLEVGPNTVLKNLMAHIDPNIPCMALDDEDDFASLCSHVFHTKTAVNF
jgi:[acyl-carrier-protein] S-malonyltransferase